MSEPLILPDMIDGKAPCPDCGVYYKLNTDGTMRKHNCPGVITVESSVTATKGTPAKRTPRGSKKPAPEKVKQLGSGLIASGVEVGARQVFSRAVPCKPNQIPDEVVGIPDAMKMIGPLIDAVWPTMPAGAQKMAIAVADQEDLIICLLEWWEWFKTLRQWTEDAAKVVAQANDFVAQTQPTLVTNGVGPNEPQTAPSASPVGPFAGAEPFSPAADPFSEAI